MQIKRASEHTTHPGSVDYFTGAVHITHLVNAEPPGRVLGSRVTFQPGARTYWHTHPLGQTLIVTHGTGLVQRDGGPIERIHPGDTISFSPGEKHWHGATPDTSMTHLAIQEHIDGTPVTWLEPVTDAQYNP